MPYDAVLSNKTGGGVSWFNPSQQLSTRQPLVHSPHPVRWREEWEKVKTHWLR